MCIANYTKGQLFVFLFFALAACGQSENPTSWKSSHRSLSFTYQSPWKLLPTLDTKKETLVAAIDLSDGKSYLIKMGNDVSKEELTDQAYYEGIKKTMLEANPANQLTVEGDTMFHSQQAHRMDFVMQTEKWGLMKQVSLVNRDGKEFFSIQILYPIKKNEIDKPIPDLIIQFDKSLLLNDR